MFDQEVEFGAPAGTYEKQAERNLREIIVRRLPVTAFRVEGWVYVSKLFEESLFAKLKAHGIRPLVYFRPFVGDENSGENSKADYETAVANHYLATKQNGEPFIFTSTTSGRRGHRLHQPGSSAVVARTDICGARNWRGRLHARFR